MNYTHLTNIQQTAISQIALSSLFIKPEKILTTVFDIAPENFLYRKFFVISTNEITKNEEIAGSFIALQISPKDDNFLIIFECLYKDGQKFSGFVECHEPDEETKNMDVITIHPFINNPRTTIKFVYSAIPTLPIAITFYNRRNGENTVQSYISKEHWTLLKKRFQQFINVHL